MLGYCTKAYIGLIRRVSVNIPVIAVRFSNFYRTFLSLTSHFLLALYDSYSFIRVANFRFFTHCIFIRSSLFLLFLAGPCFLTWSMFTYNLTELHLMPKMLHILRLRILNDGVTISFPQWNFPLIIKIAWSFWWMLFLVCSKATVFGAEVNPILF